MDSHQSVSWDDDVRSEMTPRDQAERTTKARRPRRVLGPDNQLGEPLGDGWAVYESYVLDKGTLCPLGMPIASYRPIYAPQLVAAEGRLHGRDDDALLDFARRWGHLGYATSFGRGAEGTPSDEGDPSCWVKPHVAGIALALDIAYLDQRREWDALPTVLRAHSEDASLTDDVSPSEISLDLTHGAGQGRARLRLAEPPSWRALAHTVLTTIITENLAGLDPVLTSVEKVVGAPQFVLSTNARSPIQAAYWHLAQLALGNLELARCEECGDYFVRTDAREGFCPPTKRGIEALLLAFQGRRLTSRCAQRVRARRFLERARAQGRDDPDAARFPHGHGPEATG